MGLAAPCCMPRAEQALEALGLLREAFGEATAGALEGLAELLARSEGFGEAAHPPILNLAMILKQVDDEGRHAAPPSGGVRFREHRVLARAGRCAKFVSAARLETREAVAEYVGGLQPDDVRRLQPAAPGRPGLLLAVDSRSDDIKLCVSPGETALAAGVELAGPLERFHGGVAPAGLLRAARHVVAEARQTLVGLSLEFPRRAITLTGHGLGAGAAVLGMVLLCGGGGPLQRAAQAGRVRCHAFGPPPTFEPLWALPAWVGASTYAFVHGMDCVPRRGPQALRALLAAVRCVDALPLTGLQRLAFLRGRLALDCRLPDGSTEAEAEAEAEAGGAGGPQPVGTPLLLLRGAEGAHCERAPPAFAERLLLHRNLAHDHVMPLYEQAAAELGGA